MKKLSILRQIIDLRKIQLIGSMLIFFFCLTSCNSKSGNKNQSPAVSPDSILTYEIQNDSLDTIVQTLLDVSAKDFYNHKPPVPVDFRDVQIKYLIKSEKEKVYLICGQFLAQDKQDKGEWTDFAAIKTSDYEQWIGSNASGYCQDSKVISYKISDLSSALKSRFDALQNSTK
jgi:hypothetical protein